MSEPRLVVEPAVESRLEAGLAPGRGGAGAPLPAAALGATLYVPADRSGLAEILDGRRFPGLRSAIVCLEDSVAEADLGRALDNLRQALARLAPGTAPGRMRRFLRPRSPENLSLVRTFGGFGLLDGLALPKVTLASLAHYARALEPLPEMPLLPILESEEVFSVAKLERIADRLERLPNPLLAVRVGGNDILNRLGMRRPRGTTAYETPLRDAIVHILAVFRPRGHAVAAPVYEHFADSATLRRETLQDVDHGLLTKSAIHPSQVPVIEKTYSPSPDELAEARQIVAAAAPAVFQLHGSMCEPATHRRWAAEVIARAAVFGLRPPAAAPVPW